MALARRPTRRYPVCRDHSVAHRRAAHGTRPNVGGAHLGLRGVGPTLFMDRPSGRSGLREPHRDGSRQRAPLRRRAASQPCATPRRGEVLRGRLDFRRCGHLRRRRPAHHAFQRGCREDLRLHEGGGDRGSIRHADPGAFSRDSPPARGDVRRGTGDVEEDGRAERRSLRSTQERRGVPCRGGHLEARGRGRAHPHDRTS